MAVEFGRAGHWSAANCYARAASWPRKSARQRLRKLLGFGPAISQGFSRGNARCSVSRSMDTISQARRRDGTWLNGKLDSGKFRQQIVAKSYPRSYSDQCAGRVCRLSEFAACLPDFHKTIMEIFINWHHPLRTNLRVNRNALNLKRLYLLGIINKNRTQLNWCGNHGFKSQTFNLT